MLMPFLLFAIGFFAAPFVGVGVLMLFEVFAFSKGAEPAIFWRKRCSLFVALYGIVVLAQKEGYSKSANDECRVK